MIVHTFSIIAAVLALALAVSCRINDIADGNNSESAVTIEGASGESEGIYNSVESEAQEEREKPAALNPAYLRYSMPGITSVDPALGGDINDLAITRSIYEGLYVTDERGVARPGAATDYFVSEDGLVYTFRMRDGALWSDGKPVTSKDFLYAWRRVLNPALHSEFSFLMYYIKGGEAYSTGAGTRDDLGLFAPDDSTLIVTLESPAPYFIKLVCSTFYYPARSDIIARKGDWARHAETIITNGAYTVAEYTPGISMTLEKSKTYRNADAVTLDGVYITFEEDLDAAWDEYNQGQYDALHAVPSAVTQDGVADGTVRVWPAIGTYFITINRIYDKIAGTPEGDKTARQSEAAAAALSDARVRKALSAAIDRKHITDYIRMDGSEPATAYVSPGITDSAGKSYETVGYFSPKANIAAARALLAEAGYPGGTGFPVITYSYNSGPTHEAIAQAVKGMWRDNLGITVELIPESWGTFSARRANGDYMTARYGWMADYDDASSFLELWASNNTQNYAGYNNTAYDSLLALSRITLDGPERDNLLREAEALLMEDGVVIPIFFYTNPKACRQYVEGLYVSPLGAVDFSNVTIKR